ncbi:MAG: CRTAC1 family protein [Sandaracinaceae bacterium]
MAGCLGALGGCGANDAPADAGRAAPPRDEGARGPDLAAPDRAPMPVSVAFEEVGAEAGLTHRQYAGDGGCAFDIYGSCHPVHASGGVAVGDVDGDGWPDLYFTRLDGPGLLYRNRGDGTFEDVTGAVHLDDARDVATNGAAFVDIDRDGDLDLYVTTITPDGAPVHGHLLFVQQPDGRFREEAVARGAAIGSDAPHGGTSVAVGDYDRDGWPDLHVNEWVAQGTDRTPHVRLLRNRGADGPGTFEDVTAAAGLDRVAADCWSGRVCDVVSFASAFTDLDDDGWSDLLVVQDFGHTQLFWNRGDGTFEEADEAAGVGLDDNGMGSTVGDLDGDGDLDWFVTSIGDTRQICGDRPCAWGFSGNVLYRNEGGRVFANGTDAAGVRMGGWGWGTVLFDLDHDGDLDLYQTNGFIDDASEAEDPWNEDRSLLFLNGGSGRMAEVGRELGVGDREDGRGVVVVDYDRDGAQDVLIAVHASRPLLYRNDGASQRSWLRVALVADGGVPEGLGARIRVRVTPRGRPQVREMGSVTHYLGQSERVAHVGLGDGVERVDEVEVRWPSGERTGLNDVEANRVLTITEP